MKDYIVILISVAICCSTGTQNYPWRLENVTIIYFVKVLAIKCFNCDGTEEPRCSDTKGLQRGLQSEVNTPSDQFIVAIMLF